MLAFPPVLCNRRPTLRTSLALGPISERPRSDLASGSSYSVASELTASSSADPSDPAARSVLPKSLPRKLMDLSPLGHDANRLSSRSPPYPTAAERGRGTLSQSRAVPSFRACPKHSARLPEQLESLGEKLPIRLQLFASRNQQPRPLESLQPVQQHRSVFLSEHVFTHLNPQVRSDSQHLAIEGGVVQRTQRESIRNKWLSVGVAIGKNMRSIKQFTMAKPENAARIVVGKQYPFSKSLRMESPLDQGGDVPSAPVGANISGRPI